MFEDAEPFDPQANSSLTGATAAFGRSASRDWGKRAKKSRDAGSIASTRPCRKLKLLESHCEASKRY